MIDPHPGVEVAVRGDAQRASGFDQTNGAIIGDNMVLDGDALMAIRTNDTNGAFADTQFLLAMRAASFFFGHSS